MEISSHQSRLLQQLNDQRRQELFCDCSILVEGRVFKAHRNILFASSGYFKMLLSQNAREDGQPTAASFEVFSSDTFTIILDFVYSGKLSLTSQNVIEVMSAASYLQMTDVINVCKTFIKSSLDISEIKEKDRYFSLSDKNSSNKVDERPMLYGGGWGAETSTQPSHRNHELMLSGNSWRNFGFPPPSSVIGMDQPKKDHAQDSVSKHGAQLGGPPAEMPHYKPSRTGRTLEPIGHAPQPDDQDQLDMELDATHMGYQHGSEVIPRTWPVTQQELEPPRSSKSKAHKAEELYSTMPTILGVMGSWADDDLPQMRFKCPFCTHTVKRKADLKRHLRCHTGERPYPCEACGKRFTRLEHLRSHFTTIHQAGKLICRKCKRHVTELTGRIVQEGTRRYRLCNECLSEAGVENVAINLDADQSGSFQSEDEKDSGWGVGEEHGVEAEMVDDGTTDLVIQQVDDSEEEGEEKEAKPNIK
nr:PREDICTED: zinc finger and BTB domain-containing protein 8A [Latimeria chalumnae]|eukprot:XP_014343673.1 PREDICTED: zinc finger and BTB domain-containing protein 8A [Latimeria chalumnae]